MTTPSPPPQAVDDSAGGGFPLTTGGVSSGVTIPTPTQPTTPFVMPESTFALLVHGAIQPATVTNELVDKLEKAIKDAWISYYVGLNDPSIRLRIGVDRKRIGEPYYGWENGQWYEIARIPYVVVLNGQPFDIEMVPHERFQPALKRASLSFLVFAGDIAFPQARTFDQFVYGKLPLKMAMNLEEELLRAWRKTINIQTPTPVANSQPEANLYVVDVGDYIKQAQENDSFSASSGQPVTRLIYILVQNNTAIDPLRVSDAVLARFFTELMVSPCMNCTLENSLRVRRLILRTGLSDSAPPADSKNYTNNVREAILTAWDEANPQRKLILRSINIDNDYVDQNMTSVRVIDYALAAAASTDDGTTSSSSADLRAVVAPVEAVMSKALQKTATRATLCLDCEPFRVHEVRLMLPFVLDDDDVEHIHQALRRSWMRQNVLSSSNERHLIDIRPLKIVDTQFGARSGADVQVFRYVVGLQGQAMNPAMRQHLQGPSV